MVDVSNLTLGQFLTSDEVKNSPTKTAVFIDAGKIEDAQTTEGKKYKSFTATVQVDSKNRDWRINKYSLKKLQERFGSETDRWIGRKVGLTTMIAQGGKEGIVPVFLPDATPVPPVDDGDRGELSM